MNKIKLFSKLGSQVLFLGTLMISLYCCSAKTNYNDKANLYKIFLNESRLFIEGEILTVTDFRNNTVYVLSLDSCHLEPSPLEYEKIKSGGKYNLVLEKITPPVILKSYIPLMSNYHIGPDS
jgi:hypothetical protein